MKTEKTFHCVEMKAEIQELLLREVAERPLPLVSVAVADFPERLGLRAIVRVTQRGTCGV